MNINMQNVLPASKIITVPIWSSMNVFTIKVIEIISVSGSCVDVIKNEIKADYLQQSIRE